MTGAADPSQLVGSVLAGKYRVDRVLGKGGMGYVVAATHTQLDEPVAMKFLHAEVAKNDDLVTRFLREAKAARKIRSEHVVRVMDVGTLDDGAAYMVMEYLDGDDLSGVLQKNGRLPFGVAVDYVLQACEALAEAHVQGMVHRDLKPANLFLAKRADGSPLVKVLDFGISKVAAGSELALTKTDAVMGSPLYMSPEQMRSMRGVDARSDIWALGVIVHELVSGSPAFNAETLPELCVAILQDAPPRLDHVVAGVPPELAAVVQRCLEKDPAHRFRNVGDLAAALAGHASAEGRTSATRVRGVFTAAGIGQDTQALPAPAPSQPSPPSPSSPSLRTSDAGPPQSAEQALGLVTTGGARVGTAWGQTQDPKRKSSVALAVGAVAALALVAFVVGALVVVPKLRATRAESTPPAAASTAPSPPASSPPAPSETASSETAPVESVSAPAPEASAAASAHLGLRPQPQPQPKPAAVAPRASTAPAGTHAAPASPSSPARAVNCNPPFEFDSAGNKRWKRECL